MKKIGEGLNYRKRGQDEGEMTVMMSEKVINVLLYIYLKLHISLCLYRYTV